MNFFRFPNHSVINNKGHKTRIYFQNLLSLFFVHQYAWNDVQATNPTYGVFAMKSLSFQIILDLSEVALIDIKSDLQKIKSELSEKTKLKESLDDVILASEFESTAEVKEKIKLLQYDLAHRQEEIKQLNKSKIANEQSFNPLQAEFKSLTYEIEDLKADIADLTKSLKQYSYYINKLNLDIEKTDILRTAKRVISNIPIKQCPHCFSSINLSTRQNFKNAKKA